MKYLRYLWYVVKHKWYVFLKCRQYGLLWLGIIHDWSKFLPSEFIPYARHFSEGIQAGRDKTGYYKPTDTGDPAFDWAWLLHQKRNKHHWQWWIQPLDTSEDQPTRLLPMPTKYVLEMVADWYGAGRAQGSVVRPPEWYTANGSKLRLSPVTRGMVRRFLQGEIW